MADVLRILYILILPAVIHSDSGSSHGCGGHGYLTTNNGLINSQSQGSRYHNNADCTWRIHAPVGKVIRLTSTYFNLEADDSCSYDYLNVYDGSNTNAKLLGEFCGHRSINLVSSGQNLYLEFITDDSDVFRGFELSYRFIQRTDSCGGQDFQCQNHKCVDYSWVCDGDNDCGDGSDERTCTTTTTPISGSGTAHPISSGVCQTDEFSCPDHTCIPQIWRCDGDNDCGDNSDERNCGGLAGTTVSPALSSGCGSPGTQTGMLGSFHSLNYPSNYDSDMNCRWEINVPTGMHIKLIFADKFGLEDAQNCDYDRVTIYNGNQNNLIGRYCGSQHPTTMVLSSNHVIVQFLSDGSNEEMGFLLHWSATNASVVVPGDSHTTPSPTGLNCTRDIYINGSTSGTISSPNFGVGLQYPPRSGCIWRFFAPFGYAIRLAYTQFGVEGGRSCPFDSVTVFDGQSSTGKMIAKNCGNTLPAPVVSKTNNMYVSFVSDGSTQDIGFTATYSAVKLNVSTQAVNTDQACHGSTPLVLNRTSGFIYSEKFTLGMNYPDNLNCRWHIKAPADKVITLQFNTFYLEKDRACQYDNLQVLDGPFARSPLIGKYCGINYPQKLTSTASDLYIRFQTDESENEIGFNITYTIHDPIPTCSPNDFTCSDGTCIDRSSVCDGRNDCASGNDEVLCSSSCGVPPITPSLGNSKIVGGKEATPGSWPWQASLQYGSFRDHMCGGTLISPQWVMTAGHCFEDDRSPSKWHVLLGNHHMNKQDAHQVEVGVSKIIVHENYDEDTTENDITLLKLQTPVTLNNYVNLVCLPKRTVSNGQHCYITGFGDTMGTCCRNVLKQAEIPIIDVGKCNSTRYTDGQIFSTNICAGYDKGGIDTCQGDSGGPLVCNIDGKWQIEGITSWGVGCADPMSPGVYTKVYDYLNWIQKTIVQN
ncbi:dorsal-ventral patterning tolloid-like protein 1 [Saccostrea echinata]|uniref:dorsal-ventral patterning tolloid-like protein 1 n=1 Tax=Saccostrea echinata TaxID=191078 RepID=UPI002A813638|nr:dorsal-ventral patterning tolloid-like protein 1 [Saccostrea echinata]